MHVIFDRSLDWLGLGRGEPIVGIHLVRVDAVPASLARLAGLFGPGPLALAGSGRWVVVRDRNGLRAELPADGMGRHGLRIGATLDSMAAVESMPGLVVPRGLRSRLDPSRDAVAIGAAMSGLNIEPLVQVRPADDPVGDRWLAEPVEWAEPGLGDRPTTAGG